MQSVTQFFPEFSVASINLNHSCNIKVHYCSSYKPTWCHFINFVKSRLSSCKCKRVASSCWWQKVSLSKCWPPIAALEPVLAVIFLGKVLRKAIQHWFSLHHVDYHSKCVVSENIHTPPTEGFFNWTSHPSRNSILVSYFHSKSWDSETPLTFWNIH